jgi:hypothetical protein
VQKRSPIGDSPGTRAATARSAEDRHRRKPVLFEVSVYQKAYLITRDSDLLPAIRMIRTEFPTKELIAVAPPLMGHSNDLIAVCQEKKKISRSQILASLLPQYVNDANGKLAATRPTNYD